MFFFIPQHKLYIFFVFWPKNIAFLIKMGYFCNKNRAVMHKRIIFSIALLLSSCVIKAQEVGEYGFLEIPVSPRAAALGGTSISVVEPEVALVDQNPALLCTSMVGQASLSYINYVSDINLGYASYAGRFLSEGAWAGSVRFVDYGNFEGYDSNGNRTGSFSAKDIAISGSVGYPLNDSWNIGGTIRGIYSTYESYNAFALGVDVGLNYYNEVSGRSFSMVVSNIGGQLKSLDDRYQHLPTQIAIGMTKEIEHLPFCVSLTAYNLLDWGQTYVNGDGSKHEWKPAEQVLNHLLLGLEWVVSDNLYFATGYNYRRQREFAGTGGFLRGISLGGGIKYRSFSFQAAYAQYNSVDGSLNIGLTYQF